MLDDQELIRLVASWPKLTKEQRADIGAVSAIAGIMQRNVENVILRARVHELVFEDGTINEYAQKYINALVGTHLKKIGK